MDDEPKLKLAEVHDFTGITLVTMDADKVLNAAIGQLTNVTIVGEHKDGSFYFAANRSSGPENLWDLEMAKLKLLSITLASEE